MKCGQTNDDLGGGGCTKDIIQKTVQHNMDDDILTKQCFPRAHR